MQHRSRHHSGSRRRRPRLAGVLLVVPVVALLCVPAYDRADPRVLGVPFFYWYQLMWIPLAVACMGAAALLLPADREGTP